MDETLIKEFFIDAQSHLERIEADTLGLEKDPDNQELIDAIFRHAHSIKGNAGMVGLMEIHNSGQSFESFLDEQRELGHVKQSAIDTIFQGLDRLKKVIGQEKINQGLMTAPVETIIVNPVSEDASENGTSTQTPVKPKPANPDDNDPLETYSKTYLTFDLSSEHFGIDIIKVKEIVSAESVTPVPNTKNFVEGVMNLRDQVIPVIDLKSKLGMGGVDIKVNKDKTPDSNIIVVDISKSITGIRVEQVTGIQKFDENEIVAPERLQGNISTDYLLGIGLSKDSPTTLLDVAGICDPDEYLY